MTYHSEYGQDRWLVENVFAGARNGVFVEAGALDGLFHSNSLHFEKCKGWTGVLIEPIPELFEKIPANRPNAIPFECALGAEPGSETFEIALTLGWSGFSRIAHPRRARTDVAKIKVNVRPLGDVIRDAGFTRVDYLSLDVEGAELEVLSVYPFDEIKIGVIGVEDNSGKNLALGELLSSKGYRHLARVGVDEFWSF